MTGQHPRSADLAIRTLLRRAEGIEGDRRSATRRWSPPTSGTTSPLFGQPVRAPILSRRPQRYCTPSSACTPPGPPNDIFVWLAACTLLGLNDITVQAPPMQAVVLIPSAENGELDETAITACGLQRQESTLSPIAQPARSCLM